MCLEMRGRHLVFSVAQISNLLYRRIPFGRPSDQSETQEVSRADGLEIRDTADWKSALRSVGTRALNRYPGWRKRLWQVVRQPARGLGDTGRKLKACATSGVPS